MKSDPELILLLEKASEFLEKYAEHCEEHGRSRLAEEILVWIEDADEWRKQHEAN